MVGILGYLQRRGITETDLRCHENFGVIAAAPGFMGPFSFISVTALGRPKSHGPFLVLFCNIIDTTCSRQRRPGGQLAVLIGHVSLY